MPEDQNGQEEALDQVQVEETQGEEQPEEVSTSEGSTEAPQGELPEDAKERTKREFEKLKEHNKALAEENKRLKGQSQPIPSVLDYLEPAPMAQVPVQQYQPQYQYPQPVPQTPQQEQLVDENGYVNTDVLRRELDEAKKARQKAEEAEKRAMEAEGRISRFEQDAETRKLYEAYPELNPLSEVFNEEAYKLVRNELTSQIVSTGKRDAMKAASEMSKYFRKEPQANQKVLEQRSAISNPGPTQRPPSTDFEELKLRSRTDANALFERLERSGY